MSILAGTSSKTHGRLCCSVNDWVSWATVLFSHNYFGPVGAGFPVAFLIVVSQVPSVGVSFLSSKPLKPIFFWWNPFCWQRKSRVYGWNILKKRPHLWLTTKNLLETIVFHWGASTFCQPLRFLGEVSLWRHPGALALHGTSDGLGGAGRASETCWNRSEEVPQIADIVRYSRYGRMDGIKLGDIG
jgi:hypothetical protein